MSLRSIAASAALILTISSVAGMAAERYNLGRPVTGDDIAAWNIDVSGDGAGLPAGRGSVAEGRALFAEACSACHGDKGQGSAADVLVGGRGTLATAKPIKTIGSFWPYAPTIFDYVNRAMPFNAPQSLTPDQVYSVTAYLLFLNGIVPEDTTLDAASLAKVEMPNRNGFTRDPRPDVAPK
ncbi:cytochrome c [Bradyrhizobium sp. SZCCHNPS2010]|uniref:c-type cytochrome n=1 Tax=Bradyrhizobium sp. SZCCHNPS2010 TaxID=3057333 RepID=UPI002916F69F|nr:cytochrome c [Bradyrhizobium sp. SZCCHNPS2010]